jgi:hypothetical protein
VPNKYEEDPPLGRWVDNQRTCFKNGIMDQERKMRLEEIGFEFSRKVMTNEDIWDFQFQKLREYCERHGHCELLWDVDRFTFILNTPTNIPAASLPESQAVCQLSTKKTRNWAVGSTVSVNASRMAEWSRNEKRSSPRLVLTSLLVRGNEGKEIVISLPNQHPVESKCKNRQVELDYVQCDRMKMKIVYP